MTTDDDLTGSADDGSSGPRVYADNLPEGCPPDQAIEAAGIFYAAHRASPPDEADFRTAAQRGVFKGGDECKRRGNSILANLADARQLCRAHPDNYRFVSEGTLNKSHGMLLPNATKAHPSHGTLWRFQGVAMQDIFSKVI